MSPKQQLSTGAAKASRPPKTATPTKKKASRTKAASAATKSLSGPIENKSVKAYNRKAVDKYKKLEKTSSAVFARYNAAIREMRVRLEILDDDIESRLNRNLIHHIESRLKKPYSVFEKLERYGKPLTLKAMEENIFDIAGLRVICSYADDIYRIIDMIESQDDLELITVKDYVANPKPNGYRSVHVILKVPVYFMDKKELVPVEIQFRTIAMDLWASLEHDLRYKAVNPIEGIDMSDELKDCADIINDVEMRMQILMHAME